MSTMAGKKISFFRDCCAVKRYHTERILEPDTVGHHSANVALIITVLTPCPSAWLIRAALLHDLGEKLTGDTPAPFKRILRKEGILEERFENSYLFENGVTCVGLTDEEQWLLKTADTLDLIFKCVDEIEMGNRKSLPILLNGLKYIGEKPWPAGSHQANVVLECLRWVKEKLPMTDKLEETIIDIINTNIGTLLPTIDSTTSKETLQPT